MQVAKSEIKDCNDGSEGLVSRTRPPPGPPAQAQGRGESSWGSDAFQAWKLCFSSFLNNRSGDLSIPLRSGGCSKKQESILHSLVLRVLLLRYCCCRSLGEGIIVGG